MGISGAVSARSVGSTSWCGWLRTADHHFSSIGILGSRFVLRSLVLALFAVLVGCDGQKLGGFIMRIRALIVACLIAATSLLIVAPAALSTAKAIGESDR
jgi:hypothetical protein